jgi:hypothetical protein
MNPSPTESPPNAIAPASAPDGLFCPKCGFDVTDLTAGDCPACGTYFNPAELVWNRISPASSIPGWDDGAGRLAVTLLRTCLSTFFRPGRFGRRFPTLHRPLSAARFRNLMLICALACYLLEMPLAQGRRTATLLSFAPGLVAGVLSCEFLLAVLFHWVPHRDDAEDRPTRAEASRSWRGLIGFYRSFLPISTLALGPFLIPWVVRLRDPSEPAFWILATAVPLWWWVCLIAGFRAAAKPGIRRAVAIALSPLAVAASVCSGLIVSHICVFVAYAMWG